MLFPADSYLLEPSSVVKDGDRQTGERRAGGHMGEGCLKGSEAVIYCSAVLWWL